LPSGWLEQFDEIAAVDFDPAARYLFGRRHSQCRVTQWLSDDLFPTTPAGIDWDPLLRLLSTYPEHGLLFCNVLGQISAAAPNPDMVELGLKRLPELLNGRSWASYHDRLSAPMRPQVTKAVRHRCDEELAKDAFLKGGEVCSHCTGELGAGRECSMFAWECRRNYWHLIEGCRDELSIPAMA
jgi:hypothetical protein